MSLMSPPALFWPLVAATPNCSVLPACLRLLALAKSGSSCCIGAGSLALAAGHCAVLARSFPRHVHLRTSHLSTGCGSCSHRHPLAELFLFAGATGGIAVPANLASACLSLSECCSFAAMSASSLALHSGARGTPDALFPRNAPSHALQPAVCPNFMSASLVMYTFLCANLPDSAASGGVIGVSWTSLASRFSNTTFAMFIPWHAYSLIQQLLVVLLLRASSRLSRHFSSTFQRIYFCAIDGRSSQLFLRFLAPACTHNVLRKEAISSCTAFLVRVPKVCDRPCRD